LDLFVHLLLQRVEKGAGELPLGFRDPLESVPEKFISVFIDVWDYIFNNFFLKIRVDIFNLFFTFLMIIDPTLFWLVVTIARVMSALTVTIFI
jgi:hypothetical protein